MSEIKRVEAVEGKKKIVTQVCCRKECEECGKPATHQLTFLLKGTRGNPNSSAYKRDDCSWCSDDTMFVCDEHEKNRFQYARDKNMEWCADFQFGERFKHIFLFWKTIEEKEIIDK